MSDHPQIELEWSVEQKYIRTIPKDEFTQWCKESFRSDLPDTPTLDDLYNRLAKGDHRAVDFLNSLVDDKYWLDSGDAEMLNLTDVE